MHCYWLGLSFLLKEHLNLWPFIALFIYFFIALFITSAFINKNVTWDLHLVKSLKKENVYFCHFVGRVEMDVTEFISLKFQVDIYIILNLFNDAMTWIEFEFIVTSFLYWNLSPMCGGVGVIQSLRSLK